MRFFLFFLCSFLSAVDFQQEFVFDQVDQWPSWCSAAMVFDRAENDAVKERDNFGNPCYLSYNEDEVLLAWKEHLLQRATLRRGADQTERTYFFSYTDRGEVEAVALTGNLSGCSDGETYTTRFCFDDQGQLIEKKQENGSRCTFSYFDSKGFFCLDHAKKRRHAVRVQKEWIEEIEDDGTAEDIADLTGVSWRKWSKESSKEGKKIIGAYDPIKKKDVVLRIENKSFSGEKTDITDASGQKVERICLIPTAEVLFASEQDFFEWKNVLLQQKTDPQETKKKETPTIYKTARGDPFLIEYADGTKEQKEYSLAGQLTSYRMRDGKRFTYEYDLAGRLTKVCFWTIGAMRPQTTQYGYKGALLDGWSTDEGLHCQFKRDVFGRVERVLFYRGTHLEREVVCTYDALGQLVKVKVEGDENWQWHISAADEELFIEHTCFEKGSRSSVQETYSRAGVIKKRLEYIDGKVFSQAFDVLGRLVRVGRFKNGRIHTMLHRAYEKKAGCECTVTFFPDGTRQIEERKETGAVDRQWFHSNGKQLLHENIEPLDDRGSFRATQKSMGVSRTAEQNFDETGRLRRVVSADGASVEYIRDAQGGVIEKRTSGGHRVYYERKDGLVSRIWSKDGSVDYRLSYDDRGRISKALDQITGYEVVRQFDSFGRILADGERSREVAVSYAPSGRVSAIHYPDGSRVIYEEQDGQLVAKRAGKSLLIEEKKQQKTFPGFFPRGAIHKDVKGPWQQRFRYDALGQLAGEEGEFNERYRFSPLKVLTKTASYEATHDAQYRLSQIGPIRFKYDSDSNLIEKRGVKGAYVYSYDALGRLTRVKFGRKEHVYRYDAFNRIQEISIRENGKREKTQLLWFDTIELGAMEASHITELKIIHPKTWHIIGCELQEELYVVDSDENGSVTTVSLWPGKGVEQTYRYSAFGRMHVYLGSGERTIQKPICPWLYYGKRRLKQAYDFGARRYDPLFMRWFEKDPLGLSDCFDDRVFVRNNPAAYTDPQGLCSLPIDWSRVKGDFVHMMKETSRNIGKSLTFAKERFDWYNDLRGAVEQVSFQVLSKTWWQLLGYNPDYSVYHVYEPGQESPHARITLINGMLNGWTDVQESARLLSQTHGGVPVHTIYSATDGFTGDIVRGVLSKVGVCSAQAKLLANVWKNLLSEMGGVDGEGRIFHYAHSLGATETVNALRLLSEQEREKIRVITFGAPTLIPERYCGEVENFVSFGDGVPCLDLRYFWGRITKPENIIFLPSKTRFPLDHFFEGETYRQVIEILGLDFQEKFRVLKDSRDQEEEEQSYLRVGS